METLMPKTIQIPLLTGWTRSMGYKFTVVCLLALVMSIPSFFVDSLVSERSGRAKEVVNQVSGRVGGPQMFLGPTLVVPYTVPEVATGRDGAHGVYYFSPGRGDVKLTAASEERRISLFRVPVFKSDVQMDAHFELPGGAGALPAGAQLDWSRAEVLVGVSDTRGALTDGTMSINGTSQPVVASGLASSVAMGKDSQADRLVMLGVNPHLEHAGGALDARVKLRFSGAQRISLLPFARSTRLDVQSDWRSPGFAGAFVPSEQNVTRDGFKADWEIPSMARSMASEGPLQTISAMQSMAVAVNFVEMADPYQAVTRSLKYVLLFVAMIFLSYFVFEATTGKRVHPAQYVLVGVAQTIFYLLLLSLAERTGFNWAFAIAGTATVLLLSLNAKWVFASRREGVRALVVFSLLYTLIYLLLRLEDNALLVGACASFAVVAAVMYFTRSINWYGGLAGDAAAAVAEEQA